MQIWTTRKNESNTHIQEPPGRGWWRWGGGAAAVGGGGRALRRRQRRAVPWERIEHHLQLPPLRAAVVAIQSPSSRGHRPLAQQPWSSFARPVAVVAISSQLRADLRSSVSRLGPMDSMRHATALLWGAARRSGGGGREEGAWRGGRGRPGAGCEGLELLGFLRELL